MKSPGKWFLPNILGNPNKDNSKYDTMNTNNAEENGNVFKDVFH